MCFGAGKELKRVDGATFTRRYTPGPPGYVSIVVIKRAGENDKAGRGCCVQAADEALLPSKPSSETLIEVGN